jgi:holo-[acyl-carrier protein] synthase
MIFGIGTDLVAIARIQTALARHGERFVSRILAVEEEAAYRRAHALHEPEVTARFIAKRFAAKEAFSKAYGTGIGADVGWHDVRVNNDQLGRPVLTFSQHLQSKLDAAGVVAAHVSLTDEVEHALAFVVLERKS